MDKKTRVDVTSENYKYLELLDKIRYGCIDSVDIKEIIKESNLNYLEIFKYAKITKNNKILESLIYI